MTLSYFNGLIGWSRAAEGRYTYNGHKYLIRGCASIRCYLHINLIEHITYQNDEGHRTKVTTSEFFFSVMPQFHNVLYTNIAFNIAHTKGKCNLMEFF